MEVAISIPEWKRWWKWKWRDISSSSASTNRVGFYHQQTYCWKTKCANILCSLPLRIYKGRPSMLVIKRKLHPRIPRKLHSSVANILRKEEINESNLYKESEWWGVVEGWILSVLSSGFYLCGSGVAWKWGECLMCVRTVFGPTPL